MATRMCSLKTINLPSLSNSYEHTNTFVPMSWSIDILGGYVWTDGSNIYYSSGYTQLILNTETNQWTEKKWSIPKWYGDCVWSDGEHIYHSGGLDYGYHILENGDWKEIPEWNILFWGNTVWTDGADIYCEGRPREGFTGSYQVYKLNRDTNTWDGLGFDSGTGDLRPHWTDGVYLYAQYYYNGSWNHYVFNKDTDTWEIKVWNNIPKFFYSDNVWSDGTNIYYSYGKTYILNIDTWEEVTWESDVQLYGRNIWTDGKNIYHSCNHSHEKGPSFILLPTTAQLYTSHKTNEGLVWQKITSVTNVYTQEELNDIDALIGGGV